MYLISIIIKVQGKEIIAKNTRPCYGVGGREESPKEDIKNIQRSKFLEKYKPIDKKIIEDRG